MKIKDLEEVTIPTVEIKANATNTCDKPLRLKKTCLKTHLMRGFPKIRCFHDHFFLAMFRFGAFPGVMSTQPQTFSTINPPLRPRRAGS